MTRRADISPANKKVAVNQGGYGKHTTKAFETLLEQHQAKCVFDAPMPEGYDHTWYDRMLKMELVAKLNGIPCINACGEAGFGYHRVKNRDYQLDQIHLNKTGGKIMGNFVWSKLKDIPLWLPE
jgi:hypothetical protein